MKKGNIKYIFMLLLVTLGFGFSFILIKELMNAKYPLFLLLGLRFSIGTLSLFIFKIIKPSHFNFKEITAGILIGFFILMGFIFQTWGAAHTTPAKNGLFTGLYVLFVPLIIMVIRKKLMWKPFVISAFCFLGIAIISNAFTNITYNLGDLLTTLCALSFAIQFILLEKYSPSLNAINLSIVQLSTVAIISIILSLILETNNYHVVKMDKYMIIIIFLGLVETGLSFLVQTHVQAKISANTVAVISCMESVFAIIFALIFGYDSLSLTLIVGSIIIITAMVFSSISKDATNVIKKSCNGNLE